MRLLGFITLALSLVLCGKTVRAQGSAPDTADTTVYLHVYIEAAPTAARQVGAMLKDLAATTRKETGCCVSTFSSV
jgi:hypothetical protein